MQPVTSAPKYVDELFLLFRNKGLELTMGEIADGLHLSRKTLYNLFGSRRGMIEAVMERFISELERKIEKSRAAGDDAISGLLKCSGVIEREMGRLRYPFVRDLLKEYKDIFTVSLLSGCYGKILKENLLYGMKCDLYRKVEDVESLLLFFISNLDYLYSSGRIERYYKRLGYLHAELVKFYLYSIVNDQSRILLDAYLKNSWICLRI